MKKLLLLVVTLTTLTAKAQTSVYHPFPDSSATWCTSFCGLQGNAYNDDTYQLSGQVLINGNWYSSMLHYGRSCTVPVCVIAVHLIMQAQMLII